MSTVGDLFIRRMLWRPVDGVSWPEPLIALLGPRGSGKSTALRAMSDACGGSLVHATVDFAEPQVADPIAAVAYVAFMLSRTWTNLPRDPTFHRVGLSLLALNTTLPPDRIAARARIRKLIREYLDQDDVDRTVDLVADALRFASALTGIGVTPPGPVVQQVVIEGIAALLRFTGRRRRNARRALRWFDGQFDGANTTDSLINLSQRASDPLDQVMRAFLADLAENVSRWSTPVQRCACLPRQRRDQPHEHAWVLLVDHVEAADRAGWRFLTALTKARLANPAQRDSLLVVAAVDRWTSAWRRWWREPWRTSAQCPTRQGIPLLSEATCDQWIRHLDRSAGVADPKRGCYPVWLDPPQPAELARLAPAAPDGWDRNTFDTLVRQLSGDLPAAVIDIDGRVLEQPSDAEPNSRSLLFRLGDQPALWERALRSCLPDALPVDPLCHTIPQAVAVAVHLVQPGRTADGLDTVTFPGATQILRVLRDHLWVSTFASRPSRLWPVTAETPEHPETMHPWLVACLLGALHEHSAAAAHRREALTWADLFSGLAESGGGAGRDNDRSPLARRLYYDLACDRFDLVVTALVERFAVDDHPAWVRLLDQVTAAPCRWPAIESTTQTLHRFAPDDAPGHDPVRTAVTHLVALLWLYRNPHTVPDADRDRQVHANFLRLANNPSARADTSVLVEAAGRFCRP